MWLKTTATSSQPLQKVRDEDITPAKPKQDDPISAFNSKTRDII